LFPPSLTCLSRYSSDIISKVPSSYESVVVEADGTWRTEDNKHGTAAVVSAMPPVPSLDGRSSSTPDTGGSRTKGSSAAVILDDEAWPMTNGDIKRSSTAHISLGSSPAPPRVSGGMIDLTLSSDEEEGGEIEESSTKVFANTPAAPGIKRRIDDDEEDEPGERRPNGVRRRIDDSFEGSSMWAARV
jgi:hypothetical protein